MSHGEMRVGGHPVADFVYAVSAGAAELPDTPLWSLSDADVAGLVEAAARAEAQLAAVKLRLVAEADRRELAGRAAAPSTQAWLRGRVRLTLRAAKRDVVLAVALERPELQRTRRAVAAGRVTVAHAQVIAQTIADLPPGPVAAAGTAEGVRARAEQRLIVWAGRFDPDQLRRLGRRICEVVDPDAADEREAGKLAELEKRAYRRRELSFTPDGHGTVWVRGRLDTESAAIVRRALDPFAKPRPTDAGLPDRRSPGCRVVDALVEVCRRAMAAGEVPFQRGERPQLVVTIDHEKLRDQRGCGLLDSGEQLSPAAVRRLACDAQVIPAVLGSGSVPLDLGRTVRLFTPAQRRALVVRDRGCGFHHREIHKGHWVVRIAADRCPEFVPPRYIDPEQRPVRNHMHRLIPEPERQPRAA